MIESIETDQEYGTENLRHGRLDGVLVGVRHRPFFKALLSFLLWGNLHLNLKQTDATKEQPWEWC